MRFKRVTCLTRGISHEHTCHLCPKLLLPLLICSRPPQLLLAISLLPPSGRRARPAARLPAPGATHRGALTSPQRQPRAVASSPLAAFIFTQTHTDTHTDTHTRTHTHRHIHTHTPLCLLRQPLLLLCFVALFFGGGGRGDFFDSE